MMSAGNLFATRQKAVTLRTKAVSATYTVRVGGTGYNHIKDRVITITDPIVAFRITIPDGVYSGQQVLITLISNASAVAVTAWKATPAAGLNLQTAGDFASLEWINSVAGWIVLDSQVT